MEAHIPSSEAPWHHQETNSKAKDTRKPATLFLRPTSSFLTGRYIIIPPIRSPSKSRRATMPWDGSPDRTRKEWMLSENP
ncbi:hypothetical protein ACFSSG_11090 [Euzebyella marina]|uniref:hypothetical protein n=1 Tax=Euzebyella marina TaxID=1761453 RepID=UPI0013CEFAAD|nr:hypothetical protein [Euzebyella marina]